MNGKRRKEIMKRLREENPELPEKKYMFRSLKKTYKGFGSDTTKDIELIHKHVWLNPVCLRYKLKKAKRKWTTTKVLD